MNSRRAEVLLDFVAGSFGPVYGLCSALTLLMTSGFITDINFDGSFTISDVTTLAGYLINSVGFVVGLLLPELMKSALKFFQSPDPINFLMAIQALYFLTWYLMYSWSRNQRTSSPNIAGRK